MTSNESSEEPKLIVDEDWKSQVQREKEELKQKEQAEAEAATQAESTAGDGGAEVDDAKAESPAKEPAGADDAVDKADDQSGDATSSLPPPPPASLPLLITTLATQAMSALGQLPDDNGQSPPVNLPYAKHFIDLIAVLESKTQGNLEDDEQAYMKDALHQLRMAFVAISNQHKSAS